MHWSHTLNPKTERSRHPQRCLLFIRLTCDGKVVCQTRAVTRNLRPVYLKIGLMRACSAWWLPPKGTEKPTA